MLIYFFLSYLSMITIWTNDFDFGLTNTYFTITNET